MMVFDCPDPWALAPFYEALTGMHVLQEGPTYVALGYSFDDVGLALQRVDGYQAPQWPGQEHPQQFHLDLEVDDLDEAEAAVLAIGATALPGRGEHYRVFADPVGHPFCLCH
jgi:catechol 2,3-dioxygenase-like lactoylglutathione lyase family enzyme